MPAARPSAFDCDLVAVSGGWNPSVHLTTHLNGKPQWSEALAALVPGTLPPGMSVAGAAAGCVRPRRVPRRRPCRRALTAAADCGFTASTRGSPPKPTNESADGKPRSGRSRAAGGKAFVDFQNDVTVSDVKLAAREGFRIPEHLKRYTTLGMATDQGKTGNANGAAVLAAVDRPLSSARSAPPPSARRSRRSPSAPLPAITGARISARRGSRRRIAWAEEQGAVFVETGPWLRALYYPKRRRGAGKMR